MHTHQGREHLVVLVFLLIVVFQTLAFSKEIPVIVKNTIRYKDITIRIENSNDWYRKLSWSLEINDRLISKRFGQAFSLNGDYTINKQILNRTIKKNNENNGLIIEADVVLGEQKPFKYKFEVKIKDNRIYYNCETDIQNIKGANVLLDWGVKSLAFDTSKYVLDGKEKIVDTGKISTAINIKPSASVGLITPNGSHIFRTSSNLNNLGLYFFNSGERKGEVALNYYSDKLKDFKFNIIFDLMDFMDGSKNKNVKKKPSLQQKVFLELKDRGKNLIKNSSFEFGFKYLREHGYQFRSWLYKKNPKLDFSIENVWSISSEEQKFSNQSLKLTAPPGFSMTQIGFFSVPLTINEKYTISLYAKSPSKATIQILVFGAKGYKSNSLGSSYKAKTFNLTTEWNRYVFEFKAEDIYGTMYIRCDNRKEKGSKLETAYFDGVQLEKGTITPYDPYRIDSAVISEKLTSTYNQGDIVKLKRIYIGKPGDLVTSKIVLKNIQGKFLSEKQDRIQLDRTGRKELDTQFKNLPKGVYITDLTTKDRAGKISRDYYRINIHSRNIPSDYINKYLFSVSLRGVNINSWSNFFKSFKILGIHLARTWDFFPEKVIEKYLNTDDPELEVYGSVLAENNNFGKLVPGNVSAWTRTQFNDLKPFKITKDLENEMRESMRYYLIKYGNITKFWIVMNEPNAPNWYTHEDGRITGIPPEIASEITRWAYEEKNKINPKIKIAGPSTYNIDLSWIDRFLTAGGGKYLDYFDFHNYNWDPEKYMDKRVSLLKNLLKKHGLSHLQLMSGEMGLYQPVHIPEMGQYSTHMSSGKGNVFLDYRLDQNELYNSQLLARNYLLALKHDLFTFTYFQYDTSNAACLNMDIDLVPLIYIPVINYLDCEFGNMKFYRQFEYDDYSQVAIYTGDSIDRSVINYGKAAVWCTLREVAFKDRPSPIIKIPNKFLDGYSYVITNYLGQEVHLSETGEIELGGPLYISVKKGDQYLTAKELYALLTSANLVKRLSDRIATSVSFKRNTILVKQKTRRPSSGICNLKGGTSFPFTYKGVKWDNKKNIEITFSPFDISKLKPFCLYKFNIINKIDDSQNSITKEFSKSFYPCQYKNNKTPYVDVAQRKTFKPNSWTGANDLSAKIKMEWDAKNEGRFIISIKVTDDIFSPPPTAVRPKDFWKYDSISLYFDTKSNGDIAKLKSGLDADDYRYDFAFQNKKPIVFRSHNPDHQSSFLYPEEIDNTVSLSFTKTKTGYEYRIMIPQTRILPFHIGQDKRIRFSVFINDNDGKGRETGLTSSPNQTDPYDSPSLWTDVLLVR